MFQRSLRKGETSDPARKKCVPDRYDVIFVTSRDTRQSKPGSVAAHFDDSPRARPHPNACVSSAGGRLQRADRRIRSEHHLVEPDVAVGTVPVGTALVHVEPRRANVEIVMTGKAPDHV